MSAARESKKTRRALAALAIGLLLAPGCRKREEPAGAGVAAPPVSASAEPPPTEAERLPEIREVMEKGEREGVHMRFWRMGAGTPGPDGWVTATPTRGGFEITLPVVFNDFSQTARATDGALIEVGTVGGPWEGGKLSCTRTRRLDGSPAPAHTGSMLDEWKGKRGTVSARERTWEGFPAVEVETRNSRSHAQMLIVDAGAGGVFTAIAELPEGDWDEHQKEVDRFLRSLKTGLAPKPTAAP